MSDTKSTPTIEQYETLMAEAKAIRDRLRTDLVEGIKTSMSKLGGLGISEEERLHIVLTPFVDSPALVPVVVPLLLRVDNITKEQAEKLFHYLHGFGLLTEVYNPLKPTKTGNTSERGKQKPGTPCPICQEVTEPVHNGRQHRAQIKERGAAYPFSDAELASLNPPRVLVGTRSPEMTIEIGAPRKKAKAKK